MLYACVCIYGIYIIICTSRSICIYICILYIYKCLIEATPIIYIIYIFVCINISGSDDPVAFRMI